jgi:hypothetical protein
MGAFCATEPSELAAAVQRLGLNLGCALLCLNQEEQRTPPRTPRTIIKAFRNQSKDKPTMDEEYKSCYGTTFMTKAGKFPQTKLSQRIPVPIIRSSYLG